MNVETLKRLTDLCNAIETLAVAVSLHTGVKTASEILTASNNLKKSLKDEIRELENKTS